MQRKSLAALIDSQDNLRLSRDGQWLEICKWVNGRMVRVAQCHLDNFFDAKGNYFNRDA